jgi:hypothetical protein
MMLHQRCQFDPVFWQAWEEGRGPKQKQPDRVKVRKLPGPGDFLAKDIHSLGYRITKACGCEDRIAQMNRWGVKGCIEHLDEIIGWLKTAAGTAGGIEQVVATTPLFRCFAEGEMRRMVCRAIRAAEDYSSTARLQLRDEESVRWAVAVTTAPRLDCTLTRCIESMRYCGWEPTIFAEPGSTRTDAETFESSEQLGLWRNFLRLCEWAVVQDVDAILTVQDDSLFHPDSKSFTEDIIWPSWDCGFVSLYTPLHYSWEERRRGKYREYGVNRVKVRSLWGACALVWPKWSMEAFLDHETTKNWLGARPASRKSEVYEERKRNPHTIANSDTAIGSVMNDLGYGMYFVDPSPVVHIAVNSTVSHGGNSGKRNCGRCADFSRPLEEQVFANEDRDITWAESDQETAGLHEHMEQAGGAD